MKEKIDQSDLYMILPIKVSYLADMVSQDQGIGVVDAIKKIYSSDTYKRLEREQSKAWTLGPTTLYYDLKQEFNKQ